MMGKVMMRTVKQHKVQHVICIEVNLRKQQVVSCPLNKFKTDSQDKIVNDIDIYMAQRIIHTYPQ